MDQPNENDEAPKVLEDFCESLRERGESSGCKMEEEEDPLASAATIYDFGCHSNICFLVAMCTYQTFDTYHFGIKIMVRLYLM